MIKQYIQIDGTIGATVFRLTEGACCQIDHQDDGITAQIFRKGKEETADLLVEYPLSERAGDEFSFFWTPALYRLCAGWYIVKIVNGCRECGRHTMRIGNRCYSQYLENIKVQNDPCFDIGVNTNECKSAPSPVVYCCPVDYLLLDGGDLFLLDGGDALILN